MMMTRAEAIALIERIHRCEEENDEAHDDLLETFIDAYSVISDLMHCSIPERTSEAMVDEALRREAAWT